jgi:hypothetical protein
MPSDDDRFVGPLPPTRRSAAEVDALLERARHDARRVAQRELWLATGPFLLFLGIVLVRLVTGIALVPRGASTLLGLVAVLWFIYRVYRLPRNERHGVGRGEGRE